MMFLSSFSSAAIAAITFGAVHGHMVLNKPVPFNFLHGSKLVSVNPLGADIPFPCQGLYDYVEQVTPVTAGETTLVNFTGGAQHGGGSCQFGVTYDWPPPAEKSKWKTIYTIIGGCPVNANAGGTGNVPSLGPQPQYAQRQDSAHCGNDYGNDCVRQFNIPVPKELKNGNATFAWTWFSNIGFSEMYMNCAPISISGGTEDSTFFDGLPAMFLANIDGECLTKSDGIINIPNPGKIGRVIEPPTYGVQGTCENPPAPSFEEGDANGTAPEVPQGSAQSSTQGSVSNPVSVGLTFVTTPTTKAVATQSASASSDLTLSSSLPTSSTYLSSTHSTSTTASEEALATETEAADFC